MAETDLAGVAVSFYAGVFWLVNLTYFWLIVEIFAGNTRKEVAVSTRDECMFERFPHLPFWAWQRYRLQHLQLSASF
jgi:hypothetical protein